MPWFLSPWRCLQALGARLAAAASRLHAELGGRVVDAAQPTNNGSRQLQEHWTLLHGDFKVLQQLEHPALLRNACLDALLLETPGCHQCTLKARRRPGHQLAVHARTHCCCHCSCPRQGSGFGSTWSGAECAHMLEGVGHCMLTGKPTAVPCLQTANIFLAPVEGQAWTASACDYQWTGGGLGVRDVVYLLWTSVSGSVQAVHFCCPVHGDNVQGALPSA